MTVDAEEGLVAFGQMKSGGHWGSGCQGRGHWPVPREWSSGSEKGLTDVRIQEEQGRGQ